MSAVLEFPDPDFPDPDYVEDATPRAASHDTVASLAQVTKRYANGVLALDRLSLSLGRGEIVALLGPNGAGKSTAVKLMMGLSAPTLGSVRIFGGDPRQTATRLRTGVMLQIGRAPEMLRVREHVNIFRGYYPSPMAYADLVRAAGLDGIEERMFGELSGGQRQRVLFALAQSLEGLRRSDLMDEMKVDEKQRGCTGLLVDDVGVPKFFDDGAHGGNALIVTPRNADRSLTVAAR